MEIEVSIDGPKTYTKPWTIERAWGLAPDTDLIERICEENNQDQHRRSEDDYLVPILLVLSRRRRSTTASTREIHFLMEAVVANSPLIEAFIGSH
jgi:hypothetical protein